MAISLARARRVGQKITTSKKLSKEYAAQQKRAQKRKGISGLLGSVGGKLLGTGLVGALGLTGFGVPLAMALGSMAGKKGAHELTRGMGAKTGGLKGDMYGYGEEEAMSLKKDLESQMAVDPLKERGGFGKELLSSYVSAGMAGNLGGIGKALKGKGTEGLLMGTSTDAAGNIIVGSGSKGLEGMGAGLGDLFGVGSTVKSDAVDPSTIDLTESLEGSGLSREQYDAMAKTAQANYMDDEDDWFGYAQGGQVPQQQQLMQLLALAEMQQNNAYSGTPLEEEKQQTISEMFESKGKTLGGNNTQSLSQMLGR